MFDKMKRKIYHNFDHTFDWNEFSLLLMIICVGTLVLIIPVGEMPMFAKTVWTVILTSSIAKWLLRGTSSIIHNNVTKSMNESILDALNSITYDQWSKVLADDTLCDIENVDVHISYDHSTEYHPYEFNQHLQNVWTVIVIGDTISLMVNQHFIEDNDLAEMLKFSHISETYTASEIKNLDDFQRTKIL